MSVLHAHRRASLHKHHKRFFHENSVNLVLVACGCVLVVLSIFLLFYRAQKRKAAAPSQNFQFQGHGQTMPQHPDGVAAVPFYLGQTVQPAHLGLQRHGEDQFDIPAPPYYPREQDAAKQDQTLSYSSSSSSPHPPPRTRSPPPDYIPSTTPNSQPGRQTDPSSTSNQ
ncbi:hypothetical protein MGYG_08492 [Nannizzia gypsea CBS 118893]|uniref:Uncharacterized protein n=1 Tax=Arthroderma gypseum (strain ATCC MYA-4604 / CBS 118893) TaxID=535722 RepID=E4V5V4_ARTGP|nr:hypothetical protein MGYG_08492 [Nannizzia gypsea CBS 118893]EFR05479.1 hypothetical protein MGYG_08492 [Nannizzia gypsea CBS 118893]